MREIIKVEQLSKKYHHEYVLKNVSMTINKGDIYGFVGQNGAGKSTTIRMIAGLGLPNEGTIYLFGENSKQHLEESQKRMGLLLEGPAYYGNLSAFENMEVQRKLLGVPGKRKSEEILKLVDLQETGRKKVKNFSLGMKQRLGIALALLSDPELLILDEPTNGLDPMGIVELRQLLQMLNEERGLTILISSHILSELEMIATKFGFIHHGELIKEISAANLKQVCRQYIEIVVDDPEKAAYLLTDKLQTNDFEILPDGTIRLFDLLEEKRRVSSTLTKNGLIIEKFVQIAGSLEQYFSQLIGGTSHE